MSSPSIPRISRDSSIFSRRSPTRLFGTHAVLSLRPFTEAWTAPRSRCTRSGEGLRITRRCAKTLAHFPIFRRHSRSPSSSRACTKWSHRSRRRARTPNVSRGRPTMQRTKHGLDGPSPLISVLGGPLWCDEGGLDRHDDDVAPHHPVGRCVCRAPSGGGHRPPTGG